jgi:hypothetical protein
MTGRPGWLTFTIGLLLRGQSSGQSVQRANVITLQGNQVYVGAGNLMRQVYLPIVRK